MKTRQKKKKGKKKEKGIDTQPKSHGTSVRFSGLYTQRWLHSKLRYVVYTLNVCLCVCGLSLKGLVVYISCWKLIPQYSFDILLSLRTLKPPRASPLFCQYKCNINDPPKSLMDILSCCSDKKCFTFVLSLSIYLSIYPALILHHLLLHSLHCS